MGKKLSSIKCCGEQMCIRMEMPLYYEIYCKKCRDLIFVKREKNTKPVMLDD